MEDRNEMISTTVISLAILPIVYNWVLSFTELRNKYEIRSYFCPEFRFGVTTLLMGGIFYKSMRR